MNNKPILKLNQLGKEYDGRWAVKDLNLSVFSSEIYGFLGRNGAGKTTTIRMIMGLIHASTGSIELFGKRRKAKEPLDNEVFRDIAATIEYPGFYPNMTAKENLLYYANMLNVSEKKVKEELVLFGLEDAANRLVKGFSLGMKQRLGLARAMLRNPKLLILDEPTNGLDPAGIREIRESILRLNTERGISILFSSHNPSRIHNL